MDREILKVTEEMKDLMLEFAASLQCRDICIKSWYKSKKAIKYAKEAEKAKLNFWKLARELHPQVKDTSGRWFYSFDDEVIYRDKE